MAIGTIKKTIVSIPRQQNRAVFRVPQNGAIFHASEKEVIFRVSNNAAPFSASAKTRHHVPRQHNCGTIFRVSKNAAPSSAS